MTTLLLVLVVGLVPGAIGWIRLGPDKQHRTPLQTIASSTILCALAFELVFLWQELWLVLPKAWTPGLHPILFHNDHDWTGTHPIVELLQGTGAVATLLLGLALVAAARVSTRSAHAGPATRLLLFWLTFEGLYQSLTQCVLGALLPGNDVGRALAWLGAGVATRAALLVAATVAMGVAGVVLARLHPSRIEGPWTRAAAIESLLLPTVLAVVLVVPFRVPREAIEVVVVPLVVNLVGAGSMIFGASWSRSVGPDISVSAAARDTPLIEAESNPSNPSAATPGLVVPLLTLAVLLLFFQLVLRPGIRF